MHVAKRKRTEHFILDTLANFVIIISNEREKKREKKEIFFNNAHGPGERIVEEKRV